MNDFLKSLPIAHRGLHGERLPENSLSAFRAAIESGYAIETDVRFTKDKKLIVFHDDSLLRVTGDGRLAQDCTLEEISRLRLMGTREHIPLFSEFLETVAGRVPLLIEIKSMPGVSGREIAEAVAEELEGYPGEYAIQSFQPFYVKAYKRLRRNVACGLLASASTKKEDFGNSPFWRFESFVLRNLLLNFTVKPDFISYRFEDLPRRRVAGFKGPKLAWTVRSKADETRARAYANNIIFEGYLPEKE